MPPKVVSPAEVAASLGELWSPRVIAEVDEVYVKVARVEGEFDWHHHEGEDELFLILEGRLRIDFEDGAVELGPGELVVVPKGVRHRPVSARECRLLLIERKETKHTGEVVTARTRSLADQLRPVEGRS
jgi:mannose-6-phosphate isomerase-like protein (cupin superfamily)